MRARSLQRIAAFVSLLVFAVTSSMAQSPSANADSRDAVSQGNAREGVTLLKAPFAGFRPQAMITGDGVLHLVQGDRSKPGDLFYTRRAPGGEFTEPLRVNQTPGIVASSAMTVGKGGRVHVLIRPNPKYLKLQMPENLKLKFFDLKYMLYTRLDDAGESFEPERDLSQETLGFEGIGTVLADGEGRVMAFWHGQTEPKFNEPSRRIYRIVSDDGGKTFSAPEPVECDAVGACQCCAMAGLREADGTIVLAFRNSTFVGDVSTKDSYVAVSEDGGATFRSTLLEPWKEAGCPGSSVSIASGPSGLFTAWRTEKQVKVAKVGESLKPVSPTAGATTRVPTVVADEHGEVLMAWVALNQQKGKGAGHLVWQRYDANGEPIGGKGVLRNAISQGWGRPAVVAQPGGGFALLYDGPGPKKQSDTVDR